jgi:hypothetical protein
MTSNWHNMTENKNLIYNQLWQKKPLAAMTQVKQLIKKYSNQNWLGIKFFCLKLLPDLKKLTINFVPSKMIPTCD